MPKRHRAAAPQRGRKPDRRMREDETEPVITTTIVTRQPDPNHPEALSALADALVLQMFDSGVGETLRMAYTIIQQHQERHNRRVQRSQMAEALRTHLAQLDETMDDP